MSRQKVPEAVEGQLTERKAGKPPMFVMAPLAGLTGQKERDISLALVGLPRVVVGPTDFGREGKGKAGGDPS
jgi:hypothetical protein